MTILYLAQREISILNPDGVCKKMLQQVKVFSSLGKCYLLGYNAQNDVVITDGNTLNVKKERRENVNSRQLLYDAAYEFCRDEGVKVVYLRYGFSDKRFINFLRLLSEFNIKIIAEIPTYPYRQEVRGMKARIKYSIVDRIYCLQLKKFISHILTYTQDNMIFGIPCIKTMNGILVDEISARKPNKTNDDIHIIAVSSMERWHGYERAIEGLHEYYLSNPQGKKIVLDLVGDGPEKDRYIQLINQYKLSNYAVMHGFKTGADLDSLYNSADMALGTLSAYRIGLKSTSALKTREYLAKGIPMISGSIVEGLPKDYHGVLYCSASDEALDMQEILEYYNKIYNDKSPNEAIQELRRDAIKYFDLNNLLDELLIHMKESISD